MDRPVVIPSGFSGTVLAMPLTPKMVDLIQKSSALNSLFTSQPILLDHDARHRLMQLAEEVNFRCNGILLHRDVDHLEKVLVPGLSSHCHYIANVMTQRFSTPRMGSVSRFCCPGWLVCPSLVFTGLIPHFTWNILWYVMRWCGQARCSWQQVRKVILHGVLVRGCFACSRLIIQLIGRWISKCAAIMISGQRP